MANIKVNELNPAGSQLFSDSENFLKDLKDDELISLYGGSNWTDYFKPSPQQSPQQNSEIDC
ncbi:MAG: hypothetical protein AB4058_03580 [Microcystaceae cyanobacterium]